MQEDLKQMSVDDLYKLLIELESEQHQIDNVLDPRSIKLGGRIVALCEEILERVPYKQKVG